MSEQLLDMQGNPLIGNDYSLGGVSGLSDTRMGVHGSGIYTPNNQFEFDENKLISLGFNKSLIDVLRYIVENNGKVTPMALTQYGIPYEQAKDIKYMYDILVGRVVINSEVDLIKHLKRMFGRDRKIGIQDLAVSKIKEVPRVAVVAGIKEEPYTIYNSNRYEPYDRLYKVIDVTSKKIVVETNRKPKLKYGATKKIDGVLEIQEVKGDKVIVAFDKRVCRLCNRFIVVASLKRPEFHHGLAEIICLEGTKVYVYVQTLKGNELMKYNYGTQRIYSYGYLGPEIQNKLMRVASYLYPLVCGVTGKVEPANMDYITVPIERPKEKEEDLIDE